ncbi:hypothetical protein SAMN05444671_4687 [Flavobacterium sp. CF108]|nr:hypothetical protein SAMN04487978_0175 [Flavobacterium sp. fv08]SHI00817.1 hypothetical protein SAMN05444671_4687 [Flavobacterium sp. CF108]
MNTILLSLIIVLVFIVVMTIILNFVEKDRIPLITNFFEKVLPKIPFTKIFGKK